jgi:RNA polymerase sigma-70 factor (ECF subfamily)
MQENTTVRGTDSALPEQRFAALYAAYHPHVFGYVLRRCDQAEDAADAIAETFLVAWRRLDRAPADDAVKLWLYGISRRVLANQRRGDRRRAALSERLQAELAAQPMPLSAGYERSLGQDAGLRDALLTLSDEDRELLLLEAWEELDSAQIGAVLGCSAGAARTRLHRARKRLHAALASAAAGIAQHAASPKEASATADVVTGDIS